MKSKGQNWGDASENRDTARYAIVTSEVASSDMCLSLGVMGPWCMGQALLWAPAEPEFIQVDPNRQARLNQC
jgi:hypothetical protein